VPQGASARGVAPRAGPEGGMAQQAQAPGVMEQAVAPWAGPALEWVWPARGPGSMERAVVRRAELARGRELAERAVAAWSWRVRSVPTGPRCAAAPAGS